MWEETDVRILLQQYNFFYCTVEGEIMMHGYGYSYRRIQLREEPDAWIWVQLQADTIEGGTRCKDTATGVKN